MFTGKWFWTIFLLGAPEFFSLPLVTVPGIFLKVNFAQFPKW